MIGYQFERNLSDDVTFRQNARFAHVDVTLSTLFGLGYVNADRRSATSGPRQFLTRRASPIRAISTTSWNIASTPAFCSHTVLFGLDLKHYRIDDWQGFSTVGVLATQSA